MFKFLISIRWGILYGLALVAVLLAVAGPSRAMPEYATNLGEPCATCHVSPAGGGLRSVRGQAWVAQGKPGAAPALEEALQIMGVKTAANPADYKPGPLPRPTASPLRAAREETPAKSRHAWLSGYEGN